MKKQMRMAGKEQNTLYMLRIIRKEVRKPCFVGVALVLRCRSMIDIHKVGSVPCICLRSCSLLQEGLYSIMLFASSPKSRRVDVEKEKIVDRPFLAYYVQCKQ